MPAQTRTPRANWIQEGLRALGVGGPDAVRVEGLAQALGVTKGGFYWHFEDRGALLAEMLDTWQRVVSQDVIDLVEAGGGDARAKLRRLFAVAVSMEDMVKIEMAIREWARRDPAVAARLRELDNRRMDYMRSLFGELTADEQDVEVRSLFAFSLFIANDYIAAEHGSRSRSEVIDLAVQRLMA
jgi:AcrR family transcriptional regulator